VFYILFLRLTIEHHDSLKDGPDFVAERTSSD